MKMISGVTAVSSSGIAAIASATGIKIKLYDTSSSLLKFTLFAASGTKQSISKLIFCNHDKHIIGRIADTSTVIVWDVIRGVEAYQIKVPIGMELCDLTTRNGLIVVLVQSSNDKKFFAFEYNVDSSKLMRKIKIGTSSKTSIGKIQCSPCGTLYAVVVEKQIRILNTETGKRKSKISVQSVCAAKTQLEFSSDSLNLFYCANGKAVNIYSIEESKVECVLESEKIEHDIASMSLDDNAVILTYKDGTVTLVLLEENKVVKSKHNISVENGIISEAFFHSSFPHKKLVAIVHDETIRFETLTYCSDDGSAKLENTHVIIQQDGANEESERAAKRLKFDVNEGGDKLEYNENDLSIAERLQVLNKQTYFASSSDDETKEATLSPKLEHTKAFSAILKQILQSNDDKTLDENIFKSKSSTDKNIIVNSISELSTHELNVLICKIVHRSATQPFKVGFNNILMHWMQAILVRLYQIEHGSGHGHDKSSTEGRKALQMMRNIIVARSSNMEALTGLEARLAILGGEF